MMRSQGIRDGELNPLWAVDFDDLHVHRFPDAVEHVDEVGIQAFNLLEGIFPVTFRATSSTRMPWMLPSSTRWCTTVPG